MKIVTVLQHFIQNAHYISIEDDSVVLDQIKQKKQNRKNKALSIVISVVIVSICGYYLGRNIVPLLQDSSWIENTRWELNVIAAILFIIGNLLGGVIWSYVLRSMNQKASLKECMWINSMAVLGKYVPGSIWQVLGRAFVTSRMGISLKVTSSATFVDLSIKTVSALLFTAILIPASILQQSWGIPGWIITTIAVSAIMVLFVIFYAPRFKFIRNSNPASSWFPIIRSKEYLRACFTTAFFWYTNSIANAFVIRSFYPLDLSEWPLAAAALPFSISIGSIAPFIPAGLGVRDTILASMLGNIMPTSIASAASVASRLVSTIGDILAAIIISMLHKHWTSNLLQSAHI